MSFADTFVGTQSIVQEVYCAFFTLFPSSKLIAPQFSSVYFAEDGKEIKITVSQPHLCPSPQDVFCNNMMIHASLYPFVRISQTVSTMEKYWSTQSGTLQWTPAKD